jgi:signal transduction histidine kinase
MKVVVRGKKMAAEKLMAVLGRMPKQHVLRAGFFIIIALLIVSAIQANRVHDSVSRQTAEIYQKYVKQQDVLSEFRRNLLLGSIYAREFFLNPWSHRADEFHSKLQHLKIDVFGELDQIDQMDSVREYMPELKVKTKDYFDMLERVVSYTQDSLPEGGFEFVEREIAVRRNACTELAARLIEASQSSLKRSEEEFAQNRQTATRNLFLMLACSMFIGLGVAVFSVIYSETLEQRSARQYEDVIQTKRDLQLLSARLLEVQEEERKRFSRELHDEIGQSLTALRMEISHVQSVAKGLVSGIGDRLEKARSLAEQTVQAVRDISLLLRPSLLDDLGLGPALEYQVEDFSRRTGIECELVQEGLPPDLPDAAKTCVYRVVQEALHNCAKHSGAKTVRVSVRQARRVLTVEVADDGRGFSTDPSPEAQQRRRVGLGVLGMRERAEMLGGKLTVESAPSQGTRVTMRLPVEETPAPEPVKEEVQV